MRWILVLLACAAPDSVPRGPTEIVVDARPCADGSRVSVETVRGPRACAACPCDVPLILPSTATRASGTFAVTTGEGTRWVTCAWASQWTALSEAAGAALGAVPVGGSVGEDAARMLWDDAGLRLLVPDGRAAHCGPP